jgi:hypothetical protein
MAKQMIIVDGRRSTVDSVQTVDCRPKTGMADN